MGNRDPMFDRSVPQFLLNVETLELLINLLLEKEALRRTINVRDFGPRVTCLDDALRRDLAELLSE